MSTMRATGGSPADRARDDAPRAAARSCRGRASVWLAISAIVVFVAAFVVLRSSTTDGSAVPDKKVDARPPDATPMESPSALDEATRTSAPPTDDAPDAPVRRGPGVDVEVVDADGRPAAGVDVLVTEVSARSSWSTARTDREGRARLELGNDQFDAHDPLVLATACVESAPILEFTIAALPTDRIRLVLAPTGSVEIAIVGCAECPIDGNDEAVLGIDEDACAGERARALTSNARTAPFASRVARFEHVGLGFCFRASALARAFDCDAVEFDGPRNAGDVVRVELPFAYARARVTGRLVDAHGAALAHSELAAGRLIGTHAPSHWIQATTDRDGRFETYLTPTRVPDSGTRMEFRARPSGGVEHVGVSVWPSIPDHAPESALHVELGDVRVDAEPLLVAGRVVDFGGAPRRSTELCIEMRVTDPLAGDHWTRLSVTPAVDGSFRVGTRHPVERFEVRATAHDRSPSDAVACVRGAQGIVLALRPAQWIEGRILLPEGTAMDALDLVVRRTDATAEPGSPFDTFDDGRFETSPVRPGRYAVTVLMGEHELVRRELDVAEGSGPIAMEPIDLRATLHAIRVTIAGADGDALERVSVSIVSTAIGRPIAVIEKDVVVVTSLAPVADLVVSARGRRTTRFDGVTNGARLVLERGPPVRVRVDPVPMLPEGHELEVWFDLDEHDLSPYAPTIRIAIDANGRGDAALPSLGSYRCFATINLPDGSRTEDLHLGDVDRRAVTGDPARDDFVIAIDPAVIRKVLAH